MFKPNAAMHVCSDGFYRFDQGSLPTPIAKTADYTIPAKTAGKLYTNKAATGAVNFTLPASPADGLIFRFAVVAAQTLTVLPGAGATVNGGTTSISAAATQAGKGLLELVAVSGNWFVKGIGGTWTTT